MDCQRDLSITTPRTDYQTSPRVPGPTEENRDYGDAATSQWARLAQQEKDFGGTWATSVALQGADGNDPARRHHVFGAWAALAAFFVAVTTANRPLIRAGCRARCESSSPPARSSGSVAKQSQRLLQVGELTLRLGRPPFPPLMHHLAERNRLPSRRASVARLPGRKFSHNRFGRTADHLLGPRRIDSLHVSSIQQAWATRWVGMGSTDSLAAGGWSDGIQGTGTKLRCLPWAYRCRNLSSNAPPYRCRRSSGPHRVNWQRDR